MKPAAFALAAALAVTASAMAAETQVSVEGPSGVLKGTLSSPDGGPKAPVAIIIRAPVRPTAMATIRWA
jgi:hypothetical protein